MKTHDLEQEFLRFRESGDLRALAKVFDVAAPQLLAVAAHLARRRDEAEDLVQATFLSAIERAETWDRERAVVPWLLGILALHARKLRQREGRPLDAERVHQPPESDPERQAAASELRQAVDTACGKLPDSYAALVRRHLSDGVPPGALAGEFGLSSGAARVRLHRGLKLLRRALPLAYATGASPAFVPAGLVAMRAHVLERASMLTGSPVPASGFAPLPYLLALILPLGLALPLWFALKWSAAVSAPEAALAAASAPIEPAPVPASATAIAEALDPREPEPREPQAPPSGPAVVRGRALLASGAPAAGATVKLRGRKANDERAQEFGLPANWSDPAALTTGQDGIFQLTLDPPRAYCFDLSVDHAACAVAAWNWFEILPGATVDLGDVALERAGTVVVRILDAQAQPLCSGWSVEADAPALDVQDGRWAWSKSAACSASSGEMVIERVPARRVKVAARTDSGGKIEASIVEVAADATEHVDLTYTGPDLARRIAVQVRIKTFRSLGSSPLQVIATRPGSPPLAGAPLSGYASMYAIDGCEPGVYDVEISGPAIATWTQHGVQPGEKLEAILEGNAALRMQLTNPDGTPYAGAYTLRGRFAPNPPVSISSRGFVLVDASQGVPEGGLVAGMIPGSFDLVLEVAGLSAQSFQVTGLAPNEVREVARSVAPAGGSITGRVLDVDGSSPSAGTEVQLTRGPVAGHSLNSREIMDGASVIPHFEELVITDGDGRFAFTGLEPGICTVRASWGRFVGVESTIEVTSQGAQVSLQKPDHGFLTGRLLVPAGAPLEDTWLFLKTAKPFMHPDPMHGGRDAEVLNADWTFQFGPLPVGTAKLGLMLTTRTSESSQSTGIDNLHSAQILPGEETVAEIDLRDTFPGRLSVDVSVDGNAATGGSVWWSLAGAESRHGSRSLDLEGTAPLGAILPGTVSLSYVSGDLAWACRMPQNLALAPAQSAQQVLVLTTTARDLLCTDVASGAALANVEIELRTALGAEELRWWMVIDPANPVFPNLPRAADLTSKVRTDAAGMLHLKLPDQQIRLRCVGDPGEPVEISWGPGTGPLTVALRRAP